jgi:hypothetical protein
MNSEMIKELRDIIIPMQKHQNELETLLLFVLKELIAQHPESKARLIHQVQSAIDKQPKQLFTLNYCLALLSNLPSASPDPDEARRSPS